MKKLMFAAAAALCATVGFAEGGIASANIVGYLTRELASGFSMHAPTFVDVGGKVVNMPIQKMVPVNADGETVGGGVFQLQTKKANGFVDEQFYYLFEDDVGEDLGDGWYNADGETLATRTFAPGEAFLFTSSLTGGTLTFAGEVLFDAMELDLNNGFTALGNLRPAAINIQNIIPVNADGETVGGGVFQLQTKKANGFVDEQFYYLFEDDVGEDLGDGWYNADGETLATRTFAPGEGFLFTSSLTGAKLKFQAL